MNFSKIIKTGAKIGLTALLCGALTLGSCQALEDTSNPTTPPPYTYPYAQPYDYPEVKDNLHFNEEYVGLDNFPLFMPDAYWLTKSPDFEIYKEHAGGYGDTLQIVSEDRGMYFYWAYDLLMRTAVFEGWQGEVAESGIGLGDSLEDFLLEYPEAKEGNTGLLDGERESWRTEIDYISYKGYEKEGCLTADLDEDGNIMRLRVDSYPLDFFYYPGP